ncbi:MAG: HD domain-containing protein, partial [Syntrophales bacterium]|nr:HD domain-containing protein [Syntrophales bacterium]
MGIPLRILIIEDSEDDTLLMVRLLQKSGYDPVYERVEAADAMNEALERQTWDIVISDYSMPHFNGLEALKLYKEKELDIPFIVVSGTIGEEIAAETMVSGAHDYVMKYNLPRLAPAIQRELRDAESRRERKRAEAELKESKTLVEAVVENVPLMIFLKEATDLRFVILNRAGEELLGYDRADLIGKNNLDLFPPEQAAHFMAKDREVLDGEVDMLDIPEEPILTAKKGQRLLHTRKVCIQGPDGATKYLLGISEDITERKQAEEHLKETLEKLRKSLAGTIQVVSMTVETRDPYTAGHQRRVSNLARTIAQEMGLPNDTIDNIHIAGIVHDLGKISVPAEILSKPGKISDIEMSLIKAHSQTGYDILKDVGLPYPIAEIVLQHHERLDGSGYPQGIKDGQILLEARIISVADVVEAMASFRPYRPGFGIDVALQEIEKNAGILYDREVVEVCLKLFRE